jgi:hypothetical protein
MTWSRSAGGVRDHQDGTRAHDQCWVRGTGTRGARPVTNDHQRRGEVTGRRALSTASPHIARRRIRLWSRSSWVLRRAADGQQPVFVTTGEPGRKPCRTMTADPATHGHLPEVSHASSRSSTPRSFLRKGIVQISHGGSQRFKSPHLPPPQSPGHRPGGSPPPDRCPSIPVTGTDGALQLIGLHALGAVTRKPEPVFTPLWTCRLKQAATRQRACRLGRR